MKLPEGASVNAGEIERVEKGIEALKKDPHAPRFLTIGVTLHVYNEYPKHITVGKDKDDQPIVKVANNKTEEDALLAKKSA
jgi:hypothetical protein